MDIDLVLEVTEEELLEFPEEGLCEGHLEQQSTGTVVPDYSQNSLQTTQNYTEDTSQKEEIHPSNTRTPTSRSNRKASDKTYTKSSNKTSCKNPTLYAPRGS